MSNIRTLEKRLAKALQTTELLSPKQKENLLQKISYTPAFLIENILVKIEGRGKESQTYSVTAIGVASNDGQLKKTVKSKKRTAAKKIVKSVRRTKRK